MGTHSMDPIKWTIGDVSRFLRAIGLQDHVASFEKNSMNGKSLLKIEERDLLDLGVAAKGHRIKLRENIKNLKALAKSNIRERITRKVVRGASSPNFGSGKPQLFSKKIKADLEIKLRSYYDGVDVVQEVDQCEEDEEA